MAELEQIMEEEDGSDASHARSLSVKEVVSASKVKASLAKRQHKRKISRRKLSGFERRFSLLALDNSLVLEKKRIDYVLVHEHVDLSDSTKISKEKQQQELERSKFEELLRREGFTLQTSQIGKHVYTKLFCPFKRLCLEAERVKFEMPLKDCTKLEPTTESWLTRFINTHFETDDEDDFISTGFIMNKIEKFEGHENPNKFFRPAARSFLTHHILINLNIDRLDDDLKEREVTVEESQSPLKKRGGEEQPLPVERKGLAYMQMKKNYTDAFVLHDQSERSSVRGDNFLLNNGPANLNELPPEDPRKDLDNTWTKPFKFQPLWKIRNYFGERIAFYFAWSGMLCSSLWIPTLFGLCIFFYGIYVSATTPNTTEQVANTTSFVESFKDLFGDFKQSFDNDVTPYFGLTICVWGTVFLELWKRKNAELAYEWDVEQFEANEPDRPSFSGTRSKRDPVTEEWVWYYPFKRQFFKFCFSFSVLIMMIMLVLISVVAIITYRVIMHIDYCPDLAAAECLMLTTILSSVLNAISILLLTRVYNVLARRLTEWENHRTQTQFDDALIFKLFAFQFVNSYASCFYIAFFRGRFDSVGFLSNSKYKDSCDGSCMTQLSFQVLVLMVIKPFPKFFKDIVLVWIRKMWRKHPNCCKCLRKCSCCATTNQVGDADIEACADNKKDMERHANHLKFLKHEHLKPTLGDFTLDEYTEKIIQYGFLMLFATSFPLAPLLALVTNMIDLRVDAKRLLWWYRRPIAHIAQDIGMWYQILLFVNFCGVVSNAFLIAFTSSWGAGYSTVGKLIIVIGFEHLVFVLKYIAAYLIPDTPAHVQLAIRREQYQIQKKMEEPRKDTDFVNLFPVDQALESNEDDLDASGDASRNLRKRRVPADLQKGDTKKEQVKDAHITHLNSRRSHQQMNNADGKPPETDGHLDGYVDLSRQEHLKRLDPGKDLWYCGYKSDNGNSATTVSKLSGRVTDLEPIDTDLLISRSRHGTTFDTKPKEDRVWTETGDRESSPAPGMGRQSPTYPSSNTHDLSMFSSPKHRHPSGHSTSEC